ncbi:unnamed protein product, partial [Heterosigma akashiwo]
PADRGALRPFLAALFAVCHPVPHGHLWRTAVPLDNSCCTKEGDGILYHRPSVFAICSEHSCAGFVCSRFSVHVWPHGQTKKDFLQKARRPSKEARLVVVMVYYTSGGR